jgi:predicted glycogen debranching enzyme
VTNGLGGYACGTVALANTRRYHAFLMASLAPPVQRTLLVAKVDIAVEYLDHTVALTSNEFEGGVISPNGFVQLESFSVFESIPTWRFCVADALLEVRIFMAQGANTSYMAFEALRSSASMRLTLKPYVTFRDYHTQNRGAPELSLQASADQCTIGTPAGASAGNSAFRLIANGGDFKSAAEWYWNFRHREEAQRGLDAVEDLFLPGSFSLRLDPGTTQHFIATAEPGTPAPGADVEKSILSDGKTLSTRLPKTAPPWIRTLARASDQFIVRRGEAAANAATLIAGYPWFADWGRDTMISLPGLATILGRYDITANILRTFASFIDCGMLPNRFPDSGESPEYNTADATLWMFHALDDYCQANRDPKLLSDLFPALVSIIHAHVNGTRFGIHVDAADGLLHTGQPGTQLTWMDAKNGDHAFTPRIGKAVEINALWINALNVMARFAARLHKIAEKNLCESLLSRAAKSFGRFWNEERGCLYDVIDVDGTQALDDRIRPNQILAISLPFCPLPEAQMRSAVDLCSRELLTSYGLRTLSPREPGYIGTYAGNAWQRDAAYHMGTVWAWLLGPFVRAHYRVHRDARFALGLLEPMAQHVAGACIGTISEIFDGDAPHTARGCFAQAWSVAEILRSWIYLERKLSKA